MMGEYVEPWDDFCGEEEPVLCKKCTEIYNTIGVEGLPEECTLCDMVYAGVDPADYVDNY